MCKTFGIESIGATRTFTIFLVLLLKLLSVILSYQLTKISSLNDKSKILFFTLFTAIILSMSNYTFLGANYYISYKVKKNLAKSNNIPISSEKKLIHSCKFIIYSYKTIAFFTT